MLETLYATGGLASLYALTVGLWRWGTYEARTPETYLPLAGLCLVPVATLLCLALSDAAALEAQAVFPAVAAFLVLVDGLVIHRVWRRYVAGPRFQPVDLTGKTAIVTGANTGIGRETSRFLAEMGAHVILACRSKARAEEAMRAILHASPQIDEAQLAFMPLDVSSLQSVGDFAAAFQEKHQRHGLDILINNAGVMLNDKGSTSDGLEATMATNHYGHFLLTLLLFPELEKVADGRIVNVSSSLHKVPSSFNFEDPLYEATPYTLFGAYAQSKLANVLFTMELQRRLAVLQQDRGKLLGSTRAARGSKAHKVLTANAVHPGNVQTEVARNMPFVLYWGQRLFAPLLRCYSKTPALGAYTSVHVATAPELKGVGGLYFVNSEPTKDVSPLAHDPALGERLWEMSEEVCGLSGKKEESEREGGSARKKKAATPSKATPASSSSNGSKSPARRRSSRRMSRG